MLTNLRLADLRLTTAQQRSIGKNQQSLPSGFRSAYKKSHQHLRDTTVSPRKSLNTLFLLFSHFFLMDRLLTPIKQAHSVSTSWAPHESP
jgi:hypothetical protein